jgi:hypothetical protein
MEMLVSVWRYTMRKETVAPRRPDHPVRHPRMSFLLLFALLATMPALVSWPTRATATASGASATRRLEGVPRLSHIFVIVLENQSYAATWGPNSPAHYLNSLRTSGTLATYYYGAGHASNDNYISMTSGQPPAPDTMADCPSWAACVATDSSPTYQGGVSIADQLEAAGLSWKGYFEDMPTPCTHASATDVTDPYQGDSTQGPGYNYADRHNPFIYYAPIVNNASRCAAHVVPYTTLAADLSQQSVPNFAYIVPNTCDDGHDTPTCANGQPGGLVAADAWLQQNVPPILSYVANHNGMLVITFDESANTDTSGCCGAGPGSTPGFGGQVGLLAVSPHVASGAQVSTPYDHPSLLRTIEDAFGISTYLNNAAAPTEHAMSDLFTK